MHRMRIENVGNKFTLKNDEIKGCLSIGRNFHNGNLMNQTIILFSHVSCNNLFFTHK